MERDAAASGRVDAGGDARARVLPSQRLERRARASGSMADASFVCFVGAKKRVVGATAGRCRARSEHVATNELGCDVVKDFGHAGFLSAEAKARTHECEDTGMVTVFIGELENLEEMAREVDLPNDANPAHVVSQMRSTFGTSFLDELRGKWAFAMVTPQRESVFAAVDSESSLTIYRGRGNEGGVVILHAQEGSGFNPKKCETLDVFELTKIPAGSFISGNKHITPHRYVQVKSDDDLYAVYNTFDEVPYSGLNDVSDLKASLGAAEAHAAISG